jgi:hypothetical protein
VDKEQGEKLVKPARVGVATAPVEFNLKLTQGVAAFRTPAIRLLRFKTNIVSSSVSRTGYDC